MRRAFEVLCAAMGLLAMLPFFALIAMAIKLEDRGPVFYRHPRVGRDFRKFGLLKFRSMVPDADRMGSPVTAAGDGRVTRVGRLLRKHKLDELPQLVNVMKGDLQLVGARPEVERYVARFRPQYTLLLRDRPGITDPAALVYRHEEQMFGAGDVEQYYVSKILPRKLELSLAYARRRTVVTDVGILLRTVLPHHRPSSNVWDPKTTAPERGFERADSGRN